MMHNICKSPTIAREDDQQAWTAHVYHMTEEAWYLDNLLEHVSERNNNNNNNNRIVLKREFFAFIPARK